MARPSGRWGRKIVNGTGGRVIDSLLVAALIHHAADPIGAKEKNLLFAAIFISIFLLGPGKYSLDRK